MLVFAVSSAMIFGFTSCSGNKTAGSYSDEVRYDLNDVSSFFDRESEALENTVSYIFTDPGNLRQLNADKDVFLTLNASTDDEALRREIYDNGFTDDKVIDLLVSALYDSQISKIVWNKDDSVDFYLSDGFSVLTNAMEMPQRTDILANAKVYEIDRNWFFYESYVKLTD